MRLRGSASMLVAALVACGRGEDRPIPVADDPALAGATLPPPPFLRAAADTTMAVEMREFRYRAVPSDVTGPKVYLTVTNLGRLGHELELSRADYPGYGSERRAAELPPLGPGGYAEFGVELFPGRYIIRCELPFGRTTHGQLGMATEFTVSARP